MTRFLAGVLSVIAVGVLLIAYGLLSPRTSAFAPANPYAHPAALTGELAVPYFNYPSYPPAMPAYPAYQVAPQAPVYAPLPAPAVQPVRTSSVVESPRVVPVQRRVESQPRRNWKKTALVIGGSTAAGAGVGAIFGGKKGALIGAAVGGGASTIYESTK
jgi:hypothetical protein